MGGGGFYEWTTQRRAELEQVKIQVSDLWGQGVVLRAQARDCEQQLLATWVELSEAEVSVGRLQAELTSKAADRVRLWQTVRSSCEHWHHIGRWRPSTRLRENRATNRPQQALDKRIPDG